MNHHASHDDSGEAESPTIGGDPANARLERIEVLDAADALPPHPTPPDQTPPAGDAEPAEPGSAHDSHRDDALAAMAESLAEMTAEVAAISKRLDELVRLADRREQAIDRLHEERDRLRAGEVAQIQAPVVREMIRSYDLVNDLAGGTPESGSDLDYVRTRLLDGLDAIGTRPVEPELGARFDSSRHAAVERLDTDDAALDMTVARIVRVGFLKDGERLLRPADVAVHRSRPGAQAATGDTTRPDDANTEPEE